MGLSWGVMLPIGVLVARYTKHTLPGGQPAVWFRVHRGTQTAGLVISIAGLAIALARPEFGPIDTPHGYIGLVVMALALLQPLNAMVRPKAIDKTVDKSAAPGRKKTCRRSVWEVLHKSTGYLAVVLALANMFLGVRQV